MFPYIKHQTELFTFDDNLIPNFKHDNEAVSFLSWKFDFTKKGDVITFAVLGKYKIFAQDFNNREVERLYTLNAGRVFEIEFYNRNEPTSFKLFEDCLMLVYNDLKQLSKAKLQDSTLKRFSFPIIDVEAFHGNLHLYLWEFDK